MKEKMTNNLSLKIAALLFAAGLWLISININDPYQSKDFPVTVQLQNMNVMTNAGKYVEVADRSDEITVRVRGNRSAMEVFSASNITATADLNELDENNQVPIKISTVKESGSKIEIVRSASTHVNVKIEDIRKVQKKIEVNTKNEPETGYVLQKVTTEQNALKISGPETAVNAVAKAAVTFDLEGAVEDVSMLLPVELYDADGKRISDNRLTVSIDEVQCVATILATKEVPLVFKTSGNPADGYAWNGTIEVKPETLLIAAKPYVLKGISQVEVTDAIDLQNAKADVVTTVDLKKYLPENVVLVDNTYQGKAYATASIEKEVSKTIEIDGRSIEVRNEPENMQGSLYNPDDSYSFTLTGIESVMSVLDFANIGAWVDVTEYMNTHHIVQLEEDIYQMPVLVNLPDGVWVEDETRVSVEMKEK